MPKYAKQDRLERVQQTDHDDPQRSHKSTLPQNADDLKAGAHEDGTLLLGEQLAGAASLLHKAEEEQEQGALNDAVEAALQAADDVARPPGGPPDYREHHNTLDDQPRNLGAFDARWWLFTPVGMSMALWLKAGQSYWEWLNREREVLGHR